MAPLGRRYGHTYLAENGPRIECHRMDDRSLRGDWNKMMRAEDSVNTTLHSGTGWTSDGLGFIGPKLATSRAHRVKRVVGLPNDRQSLAVDIAISEKLLQGVSYLLIDFGRNSYYWTQLSETTCRSANGFFSRNATNRTSRTIIVSEKNWAVSRNFATALTMTALMVTGLLVWVVLRRRAHKWAIPALYAAYIGFGYDGK
ncbi:hypothetical protein GGX14DRAFT_394501 [Mycena pura]|uniref:Uncharacterized protein n=1 Tax=Mycena pura TaxID=153505 RepID=A0AAD6VG22_9AGAR|nr:hypothetical protein GGX14DRAFT_394501 [Mycena pura]